jgi:predicted amidophosphoribosyltransferase
VIDLSTLDRPPLGFAECRNCAYRQGGSAAICFACSAETTDAPPADACEICSLPRQPGEECGNRVCHFVDRHFSRVHAISMRRGQMQWAISRFKYEGKTGWRAIFGRILVGYLETTPRSSRATTRSRRARPTWVRERRAISTTPG